MAIGGLSPIIRWQVIKDGVPVAGAKLYTYLSGTDTPQPVYTTSALTVPRTQPVEADADGIFPALFLSSVAYRFYVTDAEDVVVFPNQDGIRTTIGYEIDPDTGALVIDKLDVTGGEQLSGTLGSRAVWRTGANLEVLDENPSITMFIDVAPGRTNLESALAFGGYDASSTIRKMGAISCFWVDTNVTTGYVDTRLQATSFEAGVETNHVVLDCYGGRGASFFGESAAGAGILTVFGKLHAASGNGFTGLISAAGGWDGNLSVVGGSVLVANNQAFRGNDGAADRWLIGMNAGVLTIDGGAVGAVFGGTVRVPNNVALNGRNQANNADIGIVKITTADQLSFAPSAQSSLFGGDIILPNNHVYRGTNGIGTQIAMLGMNAGVLTVDGSGAGVVVGTADPGGALEMRITGGLRVSGTMQFGTYTGSALSIAGYITVTDDGGTARKLAVVA